MIIPYGFMNTYYNIVLGETNELIRVFSFKENITEELLALNITTQITTKITVMIIVHIYLVVITTPQWLIYLDIINKFLL